ncbi:Aste57867_17752 [Aphanomyces stellatus]|uniref:Aste57867_17752 protein n=1 Tax=Aphanomyces stellatus TaxID=120398 RepID=A0A485L8F5_9STRA|nr:hypothetical protein As57867_017691 [Aphanomyces stellatus]VFT94498.1 Aste57867_17752 [Aphanomyces stellatus]
MASTASSLCAGGPFLYLKQRNGTSNTSLVSANCSAVLGPSTSPLRLSWLPNATYLQIHRGDVVETILDRTCISLGTSQYAQGSCAEHTFGYFTDARCSVAALPPASLRASTNTSINLTACVSATDLSFRFVGVFCDAESPTIEMPYETHCSVLNISATTSDMTTSAPPNATLPRSPWPTLTTAAPNPSSPITTLLPPLVSSKPQGNAPKADPPGSTSIVTTFAVGCLVVALLAFVYRRVRRRTSYLPLQNPHRQQ